MSATLLVRLGPLVSLPNDPCAASYIFPFAKANTTPVLGKSVPRPPREVFAGSVAEDVPAKEVKLKSEKNGLESVGRGGGIARQRAEEGSPTLEGTSSVVPREALEKDGGGSTKGALAREVRKTDETQRPSTARDEVDQGSMGHSAGEETTGNDDEGMCDSTDDGPSGSEKVLPVVETDMRWRRWKQPGASPLRIADTEWAVSEGGIPASAAEQKAEIVRRGVNRILRDGLGPVDRDDVHKGLLAARLGIWWDRALKIWGDGESTEAPREVFTTEPHLPENGYVDTDFRDYKPMGNGTPHGRGVARAKLEAPTSRYRYLLEDEDLGNLRFDGKAFHPDAWAYLIRDGGEGFASFSSRGTCVRYRTRTSGSEDLGVVYTDETAAATWRASRDALDSMLNEEEGRGRKRDVKMKIDTEEVSSRRPMTAMCILACN
ncbi:hypothetical protein C8Q78DRAFT_993888 [Trametes maxima]|nr:hypothetical protein C8Q78DRAFT_993888 [Trametes maxima]